MTPENIDIAEASRFLSILDPKGIFTFQTYDERTAGEKDNRLSKILHGTLKEKQRDLVRISNGGGSVFVAINETDGKGRKTGNITAIRALRLDLDGSPLDPVTELETQKPHITLETSPGRFACLWLVKNCSREDYPSIQVALAEKFGGDKAADGVERCVRLPGFFHRKREPFQTRIVEARGVIQPYELAWVTKGLGLNVKEPERKEKTATRGAAKGAGVSAGKKIPNHERHFALKTAVARLRNAGLSGDSLHSAAWNWYQDCCDPPHDEAEVREMALWFENKEAGSLTPARSTTREAPAEANLKPPDKEEIEKSRDLVREVIADLRSDGTMYLEDASLSAVLVLDVNSKTDESDRKILAELFTAAKRKHVHRELCRVLKEMREARPTGEPFQQPIVDALDTVPEECEDHVFPENFTIQTGKLCLVKAGDGGLVYRDVSERPFLVSAQSVDVETGTISLTLKHQTHEGWRTVEILRGKAFDSRGLTETASVGMSIGSYNGQLASRFVVQYCAANAERIKTRKTISHLGWINSSDGDSFVLPDRSCGADTTIRFSPLGDGGDDAVHGFRPAGDKRSWFAAAEKALQFPRIRAAFYAAISALFLRVFGMQNFLLSIAGPSGCGKTKALRFVASGFGCPDEHEGGGIIHGLNATKVGIERLCAVQTDVPLFLDDLQSGNVRQLNSLPYTIGNGIGRARGNLTGMQRTLRWRTVAILTGEASVSAYCSDGGARQRAMSIEGLPYGAIDQETRNLVTEIDAACTQHHGHLLPELAAHITSNSDKWGQWAEDFRSEANRIAADTGVIGRVAEMRAAIVTAGCIVHGASILPWAFSDPFTDCEEMWEGVETSSAQVDIGKRALQDIYSWSVSHMQTFLERGTGEPVRGWTGKWPNIETWGYIGFSRPALRKTLTDMNYDTEAVLTSWNHHGWLDSSGGKCLTKKVRMGDHTDNLYCLTRAGIDTALGSDDAEAENGGTTTQPENVVPMRQNRASGASQGREDQEASFWGQGV